MKDVAQHLMLLNAVMAMALKNGSNRESVARSMKVMEHEWVAEICRSEALAEEGRRRSLWLSPWRRPGSVKGSR